MLQNVEYVKAGLSQNQEDSLRDTTAHSPMTTSFAHQENIEKVAIPKVSVPQNNLYWLSDCLQDAKNAIVEYHDEKPEEQNLPDSGKFFTNKTFDLQIQNNGNASGDINLVKDLPSQPSYKICIHDIFKEDNRNNRRMVTVVLVHQLLHAIHPSRMHDSISGQRGINRMTHDIANMSGYHDALLNLESLYQSGKVDMCTV